MRQNPDELGFSPANLVGVGIAQLLRSIEKSSANRVNVQCKKLIVGKPGQVCSPLFSDPGIENFLIQNARCLKRKLQQETTT
jgi:hypothetical protein